MSKVDYQNKVLPTFFSKSVDNVLDTYNIFVLKVSRYLWKYSLNI